MKHFSPFIIQSKHLACALTDGKPCVQAIQKLCRGEFSAYPRVTPFLTTVSRYQVTLQHLAGNANLPSDFHFASRNAPDCTELQWQVCCSLRETENSVVRGASDRDILANNKPLPFTSRSAWHSIQNECPNLRRVHAYLKQGTCPSKKLKNIADVKRYLSVISISRDGLLVVKRSQPFLPSLELIVVPPSVVDGLFTALHIKLNHPSRNQFHSVVQRNIFTLSLTSAITRVSKTCHTCVSLEKFPRKVPKYLGQQVIRRSTWSSWSYFCSWCN